MIVSSNLTTRTKKFLYSNLKNGKHEGIIFFTKNRTKFRKKYWQKEYKNIKYNHKNKQKFEKYKGVYYEKNKRKYNIIYNR